MPNFVNIIWMIENVNHVHTATIKQSHRCISKITFMSFQPSNPNDRQACYRAFLLQVVFHPRHVFKMVR